MTDEKRRKQIAEAVKRWRINHPEEYKEKQKKYATSPQGKAAQARRMRERRRGFNYDLDGLAILLGLPEVDREPVTVDWTGYYNHFISEGCTEEEAEEKANKAEEDEQDWQYKRMTEAYVWVAEKLLEPFSLSIRELRNGTYQIRPAKGDRWTPVAKEIIQTINGYGPFWFENLQEALESGPYTVRGFVESHLGWIKYRPKVYGDHGPERLLEYALK